MTTTEQWIDKSAWPEGPWVDEPDRVEWRTNGLPCLMLRQPHGGFWCGYVGVPSGHPWHGKDYDDDVGAYPHGGLTFAGPCMKGERPVRERVCHVPEPGESDDVWWLGFDCAHLGDVEPGYTRFTPMPGDEYRTVAYVMNEVNSLAGHATNAEANR